MIKVKINDKEYLVSKSDQTYFLNQKEFNIDFYQRNNRHFHIIHDHLSLPVEVIHADFQNREIELSIHGKNIKVQILTEKDQIIASVTSAAGGSVAHQKIVSPMPGLIQKVFVKMGDVVSSGEPLIILNAMKMENILKSPSEGKISEIAVSEGEQVEKGKVLIQF